MEKKGFNRKWINRLNKSSNQPSLVITKNETPTFSQHKQLTQILDSSAVYINVEMLS